MSIGYLTSYAYFAKEDMRVFKNRLGKDAVLFADSGAFTAATQGIPLSVEKYAKWLWKWHDVFDVYVNLDVVRDAKATRINQKKLEKYGLSPTPVFHYGSPMDELRLMLDEGATYIALGGTAMRKDTEAQIKWMSQCFHIAEGKATFHGFGFTRMRYMLQFPWQSVDSSSWLAGARYNIARLFDPPDDIAVDLRDATKRRKHLALIHEHGGDVERFSKGTWHYKETFQLGAIGTFRKSVYWEKAAKAKGWPQPTLFMAGAGTTLIHAANAIKKYRSSNETV